MIEVVQSIFTDIKTNKVDVIKTQFEIDNMTASEIINFGETLGYTIPSREGYSSTLNYLKKAVMSIIPKVINRTTLIAYKYIFNNFTLTGDVYPLVLQDTGYYKPLTNWLTFNEVDNPLFLNQEADNILFYSNSIPIYSDPEKTGLTAAYLDTTTIESADNPQTLDEDSVVSSISRHILVNYNFNFIESATEFIGANTIESFYEDLWYNKRRTEILHLEPIIETNTTIGGVSRESYTSYDESISGEIISKHQYGTFNSGLITSIKFGTGGWEYEDLSNGVLSDVKTVAATYTIDDFDIIYQSTYEINLRKKIEETGQFYDFTEFAFFNNIYDWVGPLIYWSKLEDWGNSIATPEIRKLGYNTSVTNETLASMPATKSSDTSGVFGSGIQLYDTEGVDTCSTSLIKPLGNEELNLNSGTISLWTNFKSESTSGSINRASDLLIGCGIDNGTEPEIFDVDGDKIPDNPTTSSFFWLKMNAYDNSSTMMKLYINDLQVERTKTFSTNANHHLFLKWNKDDYVPHTSVNDWYLPSKDELNLMYTELHHNVSVPNWYLPSKDELELMCTNLYAIDFANWYLPSKDELNQMYLNLKANSIGDFANSTYWSSSENNATSSWNQSFTGGGQNVGSKSDNNRIRAIRSFTSITPSYNLGDTGPSGGWVFYKSGNDYLECASSDTSTGIAWITGGDTQTELIGTTGTAIGTGLANTNAMAADDGYTGGAAKVCLDYSTSLAVGGFGDNIYWSSSEYDSSKAWVTNFNGGPLSSNDSKSSTYYVRGSRSFTSISPSYNLRDVGPTSGWIYYVNGNDYLETAPSDTSTGIAWITGGSTQTTENGNTETAIGTGYTNTIAIGSQFEYTGGSTEDFVTITSVGNFVDDAYWSSSEDDINNAWMQDFTDGTQSSEDKSGNTVYVRPSRSFTSISPSYSLRDYGPSSGWIYYVDGNDYLEAGPEDISTNSQWSANYTLIGTTDTAVGTGLSNSSGIVNVNGYDNAAGVSLDYISTLPTSGVVNTFEVYLDNVLTLSSMEELPDASSEILGIRLGNELVDCDKYQGVMIDNIKIFDSYQDILDAEWNSGNGLEDGYVYDTLASTTETCVYYGRVPEVKYNSRFFSGIQLDINLI